MYLRARWYQPSIGRFISQDPVRGSATSPQTLNRYPYVASNPCNLRDPSGLQAQGGGGGGGVRGSMGNGAGAAAHSAVGNAFAGDRPGKGAFEEMGVDACTLPGPEQKATPIVVPKFELPKRQSGDGTLGGEIASVFAYMGQVLGAVFKYLEDLDKFYKTVPTESRGQKNGGCGGRQSESAGDQDLIDIVAAAIPLPPVWACGAPLRFPLDQIEGIKVSRAIGDFIKNQAAAIGQYVRVNQWLGPQLGTSLRRRPDVWNVTTGDVWEIQKHTSTGGWAAQVDSYIDEIRASGGFAQRGSRNIQQWFPRRPSSASYVCELRRAY